MLCKQVLIREGTIQPFFKNKQWSRKQLFALLKGNKLSFRVPDPNPCPWHAPQLQAISGKLLCFKALGMHPDSGGPSLPFCPQLTVSLSSCGKNPLPWLTALTLETKMPLREGSQKGHVSTVCILFVPSPSPTLHSLKHGLLEDRTWMLKVMLLRKVHWSTFTTIIKQTRGRLIDDKEEILAEDAAQWWSTH